LLGCLFADRIERKWQIAGAALGIAIAQAVGFVYSWSRFSAIFTGFVIAAILARYGVTGVFVLIAGAMVLVFAIIAIWGPRTTGLRLEQIAH
jgi:putative MFS transporter